MVDVIYCDFMRAFDTVPHKRLIRKLETYGVTGNLLNWIHSFLTGRKQRVCVGGTFSMWTVEFPKVRSWDPFCLFYSSMTFRKQFKITRTYIFLRMIQKYSEPYIMMMIVKNYRKIWTPSTPGQMIPSWTHASLPTSKCTKPIPHRTLKTSSYIYFIRKRYGCHLRWTPNFWAAPKRKDKQGQLNSRNH